MKIEKWNDLFVKIKIEIEQGKKKTQNSNEMPNITFQSLGEIPLKFWIGGAGLLSKLVCTWGNAVGKD